MRWIDDPGRSRSMEPLGVRSPSLTIATGKKGRGRGCRFRSVIRLNLAVSCMIGLSGTALAQTPDTRSSTTPGAAAQAQPAVRPFMRGVEPAASGVSAWFGLRLPGPQTDPVTGPNGSARPLLPTRPARFAPGPMDPVLGGEAIHADVATIVGFSHESRAAGDYLWGRVTGRPAYDRTVDWVASALSSAGLADVRLEPFEAASFSLPVAGEVRLEGRPTMGDGSADIVLQSAMVGGDGPVDGALTAPLVYVGQGLEGELAGRDLNGKIAVLTATPDPSLYAAVPYARMAAAIGAGAVGALEILVQPGNLSSFDRDRHGCGRGLCFTLGGEDGFFLQTLLGRAATAGATVTATLSARSETLSPRISNVVAVLPGRTDRTIIIAAHADGWFGGADDNASGLAVMIALARHFASQPMADRTLVFVATAGHHSAGANGLRAFRDLHDDDLLARADLVVNLEHPAQAAMMRTYVARQTDNFGSSMAPASGDLPKQVAVNNGAPFLVDLWRQGARCFGLEVQRTVDDKLPGDLNALADIQDLPQTQMIASGSVYHTSGDDLYSVSPEALERAARFHAFLIAAAADAPSELLRGGDWAVSETCPATP